MIDQEPFAARIDQQKPFNPLEGCTWPDPDPSLDPKLKVNDVSRMSEVQVDAVSYPRTVADLETIFESAIRQRKRICVRGTQHSMGGHSLVKNGHIIDTKYMNTLSYDESTQLVKVGVGCTWADVLTHLNRYNKSVSVLQSYCNFSVGGTLSVNAHGITSDDSLQANVVEFQLARIKAPPCGEEVSEPKMETVTCTRPPQDHTASSNTAHTLSETEELFNSALGGYGLFGIIIEVTLKVVDNVDLVLDSLTCLRTENKAGSSKPSEFQRIWESCRQDPSTNIKLARLNTLTLETASMYVFRSEATPVAVKSKLSVLPNKLSVVGKLLYKWALPLMKEYRYSLEEKSGKGMDMPSHSFETTRNEVLWESGLPLSKLYSPFVVMDDTFVLQEFFVPSLHFQDWIRTVRPIFHEIDAYQKNGSGHGVKAHSLVLLNTTIRFVKEDATTVLSYSPNPGGVYSFVLYFRIKRDSQVENDLGVFHNRLAEAAVKLGGTFYLPYRKCYSYDLLERAYPKIAEFAALKEKYDPLGYFSNEWFEEFVLHLCSDRFQKSFAECTLRLNKSSADPRSTTKQIPMVVDKDTFQRNLPRTSNPLLLNRQDSYRILMANHDIRKRFEKQFLVNGFNIVDPSEMMRIISHASRDPRNQNDCDIYNCLWDHFHGESAEVGGLASLKQKWRAVRQLSKQKQELSCQTGAILHRLGLFGRIRAYLSVGDHGKTVRNYLNSGLMERCVDTKVFVAHTFSDADDKSMNAVLERGSLDRVGDISIQYDCARDNAVCAFGLIESGTVDLVTLNQGLHHISLHLLYDFLTEIHRVLCKGGVFILREHDMQDIACNPKSATSAPVAMLDVTHSVFNAVTGVSKQEEANEIRAFRPLSEWREILTSMGFVDQMQYGLEIADPTFDFMMCFTKGYEHERQRLPLEMSIQQVTNDSAEPHFMETVRTLLAQIPSSTVAIASKIVNVVLEKLPTLSGSVESFFEVVLPQLIIDGLNVHHGDQVPSEYIKWIHSILSTHSTLTEILKPFLNRKKEDLISIATGFKELLGDIQVREASDIAGLLSTPELWLILPTIQRIGALNPGKVGSIEGLLLCFVEKYCPALLNIKDETSLDDFPTSKETKTDIVIADNACQSDISMDSSVETSEVLFVMTKMRREMDGLLDPTIVLPNSGLSLSQQSSLIAALGSTDFDNLALRVAFWHDPGSWIELRECLIGETDSVLQRGVLPTKDLIFSKSENHPWRRAVRAFFKGPRLQLSQKMLFGMRMLNMNEIAVLYKEAKKDEIATGRLSRLPSAEEKALTFLMKDLHCDLPVKEIVIRFSNTAMHNLYDVAEVVDAQFGYRSLTSSLTDVTTELRALHSEAQLSHSRVRQRESNRYPGTGWLPIDEATLASFRNKSSGVGQLGDSMRKVVVGAGTLGLAGKNILKLKYIPVSEDSSVEEKSAHKLCEFVRRNGMLTTNSHESNGVHTWFKLSEWMQVEMIAALSSSLHHTPWYHFPFMEFISTYFRVLFQECKVVAKEHGLEEAFGSMAFATDLIPGCFMALFFSQLQLLAYPLKLALPSYDPENMVEEILLIAALPCEYTARDFFVKCIDSRILDAEKLYQPEDKASGLIRLVVPTFLTMSETLIAVGQRLPSATVLQISNQRIVQVRVSLHLQDAASPSVKEYIQEVTASLNTMKGISVVTTYRFPMDNQQRRIAGDLEADIAHLAVRVEVTSLLALVRWADRTEDAQVAQIYDFWAG